MLSSKSLTSNPSRLSGILSETANDDQSLFSQRPIHQSKNNIGTSHQLSLTKKMLSSDAGIQRRLDSCVGQSIRDIDRTREEPKIIQPHSHLTHNQWSEHQLGINSTENEFHAVKTPQRSDLLLESRILTRRSYSNRQVTDITVLTNWLRHFKKLSIPRSNGFFPKDFFHKDKSANSFPTAIQMTEPQMKPENWGENFQSQDAQKTKHQKNGEAVASTKNYSSELLINQGLRLRPISLCRQKLMFERERAQRFDNSIKLPEQPKHAPQTEPHSGRRIWTEVTTPTISTFSLLPLEDRSHLNIVRPKATQYFCLPSAQPFQTSSATTTQQSTEILQLHRRSLNQQQTQIVAISTSQTSDPFSKFRNHTNHKPDALVTTSPTSADFAANTFSDNDFEAKPAHLYKNTRSKVGPKSKGKVINDQCQRMPTPQFFKSSECENNKISKSDQAGESADTYATLEASDSITKSGFEQYLTLLAPDE